MRPTSGIRGYRTGRDAQQLRQRLQRRRNYVHGEHRDRLRDEVSLGLSLFQKKGRIKCDPAFSIFKAKFRDRTQLMMDEFFEFFGELRKNFENVADDSVSRFLEDWRVRVFVDRNNDF